MNRDEKAQLLAELKQLFEEEKDAIEIVKIKDIMEKLEETTDAADHVGKLLANLIVKYA